MRLSLHLAGLRLTYQCERGLVIMRSSPVREGLGYQPSASIAVANPPSRLQPVNCGLLHRFSRCVVQYEQIPQMCPSHGIQTRSPRDSPSTPGSDRIDTANDLVSLDDRHKRMRQFAVHNMQVGRSNATSPHLFPDLVRSRLPIDNEPRRHRRRDRQRTLDLHGDQAD